jgi:hypothetical protein
MYRKVLLVTPMINGVVNETIGIAKMFCRVAEQQGCLPLSPILHALSYRSFEEYSASAAVHYKRLYDLADCLWLYLYGEEHLDRASFYILDHNCLDPEDDQDKDADGSLRKPVFLVIEGGRKNEYIAAPLDWYEVDDLLASNLSQELRMAGL